jgi:hypothetical protein
MENSPSGTGTISALSMGEIMVRGREPEPGTLMMSQVFPLKVGEMGAN